MKIGDEVIGKDNVDFVRGVIMDIDDRFSRFPVFIGPAVGASFIDARPFRMEDVKPVIRRTWVTTKEDFENAMRGE